MSTRLILTHYIIHSHHTTPPLLAMSQPPSATFTLEQLRTLPLDVLLHHLIPLLAQQPPAQSHEALVRQWVLEITDWAVTHCDARVGDFPGFDSASLHDDELTASDLLTTHPLKHYMLFGPEEVPVSVYLELVKDRLWEHYCCQMVTRRRVQQYKRKVREDD